MAEANASALHTAVRSAPLPQAGEGLMECGSEASARRGRWAYCRPPLSHSVGEGQGVRATAYLLRRRRPSKPAKPVPSASRLAGSGTNTVKHWL
jgi:hypothetical protein